MDAADPRGRGIAAAVPTFAGTILPGSPPSSRGLGRHPFKVEIRGSNPLGGTTRRRSGLTQCAIIGLRAGHAAPATADNPASESRGNRLPARIAARLVVVVTALLAATPVPTLASHPVPNTEVVQSDLVVPWDLAFTPSGAMLVTERPGRIRVYASGAAGAALVGVTTVPGVRAEHESGLNGIAVDSAFDANRFVYVCAARDADGSGGPAPWVNEVLRYRMTPQLALVDPTVILTGAVAHTQHNGCSLEMDGAGHLWVGIGDGGVGSRAQDPSSLNGKILRVHRDGSIPADNPVLPGSDEPSAVYSMGHRNPQGIAFHPGSGQAYAAEHGPNVDDEINAIVPGGNYGWPCYTGAANPFQPAGCAAASAYLAPVWTSGATTIASSGLAFLNHPAWGAWNGSAVSAQLKEQDLRRFVPSGASLLQSDVILDGQFGRLRAAVQAPDGALYLTTSNGTADRVVRVTPGDVPVDRYAGADRYETAATVSRNTFPAGVPVAYVATGANFPDALAGGAAAARDRAPLLLVNSTSIPATTRAELARLAPHRIVILGGTGVIGSVVEGQLAALAPGGTLRLAGTDRYATAAAISRATFAPGVPVAYVVTGTNYPDALAAGPAAGVQGGPVLLVTATQVPSTIRTELARLRPQRIVIIGGTGVVGPAVAAELQAFTISGVLRRAGHDRYATAVAVSQATFGAGVDQVFVATGLNFPDGLAGGPAAGLRGGPVLIVPGSSLPTAVGEELARLDPDRVTLLGGEAIVSDAVRAAINAIVNP